LAEEGKGIIGKIRATLATKETLHQTILDKREMSNNTTALIMGAWPDLCQAGLMFLISELVGAVNF